MKRINVRHWLIKKLGGYTECEMFALTFGNEDTLSLDDTEVITVKTRTEKDFDEVILNTPKIFRQTKDELIRQMYTKGLLEFSALKDEQKKKYILMAQIKCLKPDKGTERFGWQTLL